MKKAKVFNKSLIVGSGPTALPGTVLTAGRSYAWLTFAAQAKESVFCIEEIDFSGYTPLIAAGLNPSVSPTSNQMFADVAESEVGESVRGMESLFIPCFRVDTRAWCDTIARLKS
jgi:hypothetical protein